MLKNVWDKNFDTNTNVVDVYVNYLRSKIDKDFDRKLIRTVVGVGYMMEEMCIRDRSTDDATGWP